MSLVKCEIDFERGIYRNFDFALRIIYEPDKFPKDGIVYIRETENRVKEVELPIEVSRDKLNPIRINFKPLEKSAMEGVHGSYIVEDLEGFFKEIRRKWELVTTIRRPEGSFLEKEPLSQLMARHIGEYPELREKKYRERLPQHIRTRIEDFLEKEKQTDLAH